MTDRGLSLVNGGLTTLIGIAALVWPRASLMVISSLFAISLLSNGVLLMATAVTDRHAESGRRLLFGVLGVLAMLAGVLCLREPLQTLAAIALLIASWWMFSGVLLIVAAISASTGSSRIWAAAGGLASFAGGLIVLFQPRISLLTLEIMLGVLLIVMGALLTVDGLRAAVPQN